MKEKRSTYVIIDWGKWEDFNVPWAETENKSLCKNVSECDDVKRASNFKYSSDELKKLEDKAMEGL